MQLNEEYSFETVPGLLGGILNGEWFASSQNGPTIFKDRSSHPTSWRR